MEAVKEKIEIAKDHLTNGNNSYESDMYVKGMIQAFRDILEVRPDVISEEEKEPNEI